ncbi:MAG TPA: hypothetical protein ENK57_01350 [Polyangiaceae bacterium]|nr:hypothetical protein [Polyangiaceae bacterium]
MRPFALACACSLLALATPLGARESPPVSLEGEPPPEPPPSKPIPDAPEEPAPRFDPDLSLYPNAATGPGMRFELVEPPAADGRPLWLGLHAHGAIRGEMISAIPVDRDGNEHDPGPIMNAFFRLGAELHSGTTISDLVELHSELEADLPTGVVGPGQELEGEAYPGIGGADVELRKANGGIAFDRYFRLDVGWMTSHWGMGLLANDGAHGWEPGSARFIDPRSGDRPWRVRAMTGPHLGALGLVAVFAFDILSEDLLSDDDILLQGDHARQYIAAVRLGDLQNYGGFYGVYRQQRTPAAAFAGIADDRDTNVWVFDAHVHGEIRSGEASLEMESEAAFVIGDTELAPSVDFPVHEVRQLGVAARINAGVPWLGGVLDVLYASGDQNLDDDQQNAFRADPNFELGLLLFRQVLASQSARSQFTAGDPSLVGVPNENLERLPTRGSVTNTVAFFPRLRGRPFDGFEIYGGPLFALAPVPLTDPLNTRSNGGRPSSSLGGVSGNLLGVELDVGARYRVYLGGPELTLGVETGALRPGNALRDLQLERMDWVYGGRAMLDVRL